MHNLLHRSLHENLINEASNSEKIGELADLFRMERDNARYALEVLSRFIIEYGTLKDSYLEDIKPIDFIGAGLLLKNSLSYFELAAYGLEKVENMEASNED